MRRQPFRLRAFSLDHLRQLSEVEVTPLSQSDLLIIALKSVVLALSTRALGGQAANLALILDAAGDLYGTTSNEGGAFGTVFKITQ
jgi:hypothetical protein